MPDLATVTRLQALDYFDNGWTLTEVLFSSLQGEAAFRRLPYHRLRYPLVFYYAHPAALFVNKLRLAGLASTGVDEQLERRFETGVDETAWDADWTDETIEWPAIRELAEYRRQVHTLIRTIIEEHPGLADGHAAIDAASPLWALFMGMEHERIHLELSSVLVRELPLSLLQRPEAWPADGPTTQVAEVDDRTVNPLVDVPATTVSIGKRREHPSFGWDNEYGERRVDVAGFAAARYLTTNRELHSFVTEGGYRESRYWTERGWRWRCKRNAKWPPFWIADGPAGLHHYRLRTLFSVIDMQWDWPALVNAHEAHAFCQWRRARTEVMFRLPTEAEYHALHGHASPEHHGLADGSEGPVTRSSRGNAWEWIDDDFGPLDGFEPHPLYEDFSVPCFDGDHQMVLGGSFVSTGASASPFARHHFRRHFFQHAGFRVACSSDASQTSHGVRLGQTASAYDSAELRDQYVLLHYGALEDLMPWPFGPQLPVRFPTACAELVNEWCARAGVATIRALDVGCAVGGSAFELARRFASVTGIDRSTVLLTEARTMQTAGRLGFSRRDEGELVTERVATLDPAIERGRVTFVHGDAAALPASWIDFDAVLIANVLCRMERPRDLLARLGGAQGVVRRGGILAITSPFTWSETFTPRSEWLGGLVREGRAVDSFHELQATLADDFELLDQRELPLVIREHARKFQYIVAQATVWKRRS